MPARCFHWMQLTMSTVSNALLSEQQAMIRESARRVAQEVVAPTAAQRDQARRFMTLIDALYEHHVTTVIAAADRPERLYPEGDGAIEFQRTVSRLNEMQSTDYVSRPHLT